MADVAASGAAAFGAELAGSMATCWTKHGQFARWNIEPTTQIPLSPATHALHYGSSCFEGLKAHRGADGVVRLFRAADHAARLAASAEAVCLPVPEPEMVLEMIHATVRANLAAVPEVPGALYIRPTLIGVEPNIGAAAAPSAEALLFIVASAVGEYYGVASPLTVSIESLSRTAAHFGSVKAGGNYASALSATMRARRSTGANQVLFAPNGEVQETGTSNFLLIDESRIVTRGLDSTFLHGITRDSVLTLAADHGYRIEERPVLVDEVVQWASTGEAALVGTAAVMTPVGELVYMGARFKLGAYGPASHTIRLRDSLLSVQRGSATDKWGWLTAVID